MRVILHSDLNNFYASVECLKHPEYRDLPLAVVGNKEERHGIVLAKNQIAKREGVKTGDVYWLAKQKCGNLIEITADFPSYLEVSKAVRKIYEDYTDRVEAFGIDECWLDVTESVKYRGDGETIAREINERVKRELGLTVSVGVSWNKIFAKLGSDMKKPDAVTVITPENFRSTVWNLPVEELLYVGKATKRKLNDIKIYTIGELAQADLDLVREKLNKWGVYLHAFANGDDVSPVMRIDEEENIKSIGNSLTNYKDLETEDEVKTLIYLLSESVSARMRETGLIMGKTVHLSVRDSNLVGYGRQKKLQFATNSVSRIATAAFEIFKEIYPWRSSVRGLGVTVSDFETKYEQQNIFSYFDVDRELELNKALDKIRSKYGNKIIQRAIVYKDTKLKDLDIKDEHVIHPYNFFR